MQVNAYNPYNYAYGRSYGSPPPNAPPSNPPQDNISELEGQNLSYRILEDQLKLKVPYIRANLIDTTPKDPMNLGASDFNLHLKSAEIKVSDVDASMTIGNLLQKHPKVPVQDVRVVFAPDNRIMVEAKVSKFGFKIPVQVQGGVQALPNGHLQITLQNLKMAGVPLKGAMDSLGLTVDKLLKMRDPSKGYYTQGNSLIVDLSKITEAPGLQGHVRAAKTHLGHLSLLFGDTPQDAQQAIQAGQSNNLNYMKLTGGHIYHNGYFVKDGIVRLDDKTPNDPLNFGNSEEANVQLQKGFVGIPQFKFNEILKNEIGEDSSFGNLTSELHKDRAHIKGTMYSIVPVQMDMFFDKTHDGRLMFTPKNPKALGFIPLPEKWVGKKVQDMISDGEPYGDGVAINGIDGIQLGKISRVLHQQGHIVLQIGNGQPPVVQLPPTPTGR